MDGELGLLYELALISVIVGGGYWGWFFTTRQPHGTVTYGLMQLASAALAGLGLIGHRYDVSWMGIAGAIGVGGGTCLSIIGPLLRAGARRLAGAERFGAASRLLDIADVLAPGSGAGDEKALLGAMREIRDGKIEPTVDALTAAKARAPDDAKLAIDERIAMLYLAAYRWEDAIAHAEANLFGAVPPHGADAPASSGMALRRALGIAPPVYVELLGAYGRKGDLDQAARMLARLEEACSGREDAAIWLHRGRLMFLALAGRVSAVRAFVDPRRSRHMNPAARTYWVAVAHERHGEPEAAEVAYAKARSKSRGRPREMIDQALANLMNAKVAELSPLATELVSRVEAAPVPQVAERRRPHGPWATRVLSAAILGAALAITLALGSSSDIGVLLRGGAMVRGLVASGEWWRLVSCIFVHVGIVHLLLNAVGLYFVGRLAEDLFGGVRTIAIFGLAGVAGSTASYFASPAAMSAGASGAIFGLLGALFIELTLHRRRHRAAWNRGMWGSVAIVTVAQLGLGLVYPIMDQWAHGAGLAGGVIAGIVFSPNARWTKPARYLAAIVAICFAGLVAVTAYSVVSTSVTDSLERAPAKRFELGGVSVTAPSTWLVSGDLRDPDLLFIVSASAHPVNTLPQILGEYMAGEPKIAHERQFDHIATAPDRVIPLPPGWEGGELVAFPDSLGPEHRYRIVVAGRIVPQGTVLVSLYLPETIGRQAPAFFTKLLASIE